MRPVAPSWTLSSRQPQVSVLLASTSAKSCHLFTFLLPGSVCQPVNSQATWHSAHSRSAGAKDRASTELKKLTRFDVTVPSGSLSWCRNSSDVSNFARREISPNTSIRTASKRRMQKRATRVSSIDPMIRTTLNPISSASQMKRCLRSWQRWARCRIRDRAATAFRRFRCRESTTERDPRAASPSQSC